jgi:hypothetical protein
MQQCIKIYYSIFIWSSTCFGRHTAHHQEPKTALAASGFAYVKGCWTCSCWTLSASGNYTSDSGNLSTLPFSNSELLPQNLVAFFSVTIKISRFSKQTLCFFLNRVLRHSYVIRTSKIRIEDPTRCHSVSNFYFIFIWSSSCVPRNMLSFI